MQVLGNKNVDLLKKRKRGEADIYKICRQKLERHSVINNTWYSKQHSYWKISASDHNIDFYNMNREKQKSERQTNDKKNFLIQFAEHVILETGYS